MVDTEWCSWLPCLPSPSVWLLKRTSSNPAILARSNTTSTASYRLATDSLSNSNAQKKRGSGGRRGSRPSASCVRPITNPIGSLSHTEPTKESEDGSAAFIDVVHHRLFNRVRPRTGRGGGGPRLSRGGDGPKSAAGRRHRRRRASGPHAGPAARRDRSSPGRRSGAACRGTLR